jgi:hypothetical protein
MYGNRGELRQTIISISSDLGFLLEGKAWGEFGVEAFDIRYVLCMPEFALSAATLDINGVGAIWNAINAACQLEFVLKVSF